MIRQENISLSETPAEVARQLCHLPGFVFLDSASSSDSRFSILGSSPEKVLEGTLCHPGQLTAEIAMRTTPGGDLEIPCGAAIGWFEFDGRFRFGIYPDLLIYDHTLEKWWKVGNPILPAHTAHHDFQMVAPIFRPEISREHFCTMVRNAQDYIAAGDIYQVCLSHRFSANFHGDPWPFYAALRHYSPAPYSAYLSLDGRTVLSSSPERFLRMSGRTVETRPIKGTRPRHMDADSDERSAYELLTSPKEIAELVMITDLERSDLGRVCEYGSVHVSDLLKLERYEQVFHLVSTVRGTLRPDVSHFDALAACFPGGSISGAPKKRALEIIAELEPSPRGLYTGAIGYFGFNGESQFNIAIRTAVVENGLATFHSGAGIVADSIPGKEWQETLDKAAGILLAASRMNVSEPSPRDLPATRQD